MKKILALFLVVIIISVVDVFFVKYIFKDKILSIDINIPFDNSCMIDTDCMIVEYYGDFGHTCPDRVVDYSEDKYVAVNKNSYTEYVKIKYEEEKNVKKSEGVDVDSLSFAMNYSCALYASKYINKNYTSTCYQNKCTKIRRSVIHVF